MVKDPGTGKLAYKDYLKSIYEEIEVMKKLNATNVCKLQEVIDCENEDKLILVIDFCAKGDITKWDESLNRFDPRLDGIDIYSES